MIKVINDIEEWKTLLTTIEHYDFYHTYDYHQLSKNANEHPILIHYTDGHTSLVLPFLLRDIEDSDYKDATSVYGYAGLLALNIDKDFNPEQFQNELTTFFNENKIIAVFSRFHPFIKESESVLNGLGDIVSLGKVVFIDLNKPLKDLRTTYNRRLRTYLNKSRRLCTVFEGHTETHIDTFIKLYLENMTRIGADESYHFSRDYYYRLLTSNDFDSKLMLCKHNETQEIIAGAIFIKTGSIVQYHLSGLNEAYFKLQPIKLIIDEMCIVSSNEGSKYLNLGGGKGSQEDSLYRFKRKFSKNVKIFKVWKYIVNKDIYKTLAENHLKTQLEYSELNNGYFPAYRAPIKSIISFLSAIELITLPF